MYPLLQVNPQALPVQVGDALAGVGQTLPHAPQLLTSVTRLRHAAPQLVRPDGQVGTQAPAEQVTEPPVGAVHTVPQVPQLLTSVARVRQAPAQLV